MLKFKKIVALLVSLFLLSLTTHIHAEEPQDKQHTKSETPTFRQAQIHKLTLAELQRKYADTFKFRGPYTKQIALTFDDVPDPRYTPQVLKILKQKKVRATFFIVGSQAKYYPELVKAIRNDGHAIGNHSYDHPLFKKMRLAKFQRQILSTERVLYNMTGVKPKLIRPPYGEINEEQIRWAKKRGYKIVDWDVDSLDWKGLSKQQVKMNVLNHAGPGSIILQHAGGGPSLDGTVEALPVIIDNLKARGYQFVTVPQLIHTSENKTPPKKRK